MSERDPLTPETRRPRPGLPAGPDRRPPTVVASCAARSSRGRHRGTRHRPGRWPSVPVVATRGPGPEASPATTARASYAFVGDHQAGVTTPLQDHLHFAAFDMVEGTGRRELKDLLREWSDCGGAPDPGDAGRPAGSPRSDPARRGRHGGCRGSAGERSDHHDRHGTRVVRARRCRPLRHRRGPTTRTATPARVHRRRLTAASSDGDLAIQVCSDDPQVAVQAVRTLSRIADGTRGDPLVADGIRAHVRDPGSPADTTQPPGLQGRDQQHPRRERGDHRPACLAPIGERPRPGLPAAPIWSSARSRCCSMTGIDSLWLRRRRIIGRTKETGAPLSGGEEFTRSGFRGEGRRARMRSIARHMCGSRTHRATAGPGSSVAATTTWTAPTPRVASTPDSCSSRTSDHLSQFITIQRALASDLLNPFIRHIGSAIFVVPPGASEGGFVGETLLG